VLGNLHERVYRATHGVLGHRIPGAPPILLLDTIGAKTGTPRTAALAYLEDGPNVVIIASKGGSPRNPGWFHNLHANPDTTIQIGRERRAVHARVADPDERARLWPRAVEMHGGYESYQARTQREIPLVILEPRGSQAIGAQPGQ
jgi:F420H(2)-dependent quinone reductase